MTASGLRAAAAAWGMVVALPAAPALAEAGEADASGARPVIIISAKKPGQELMRHAGSASVIDAAELRSREFRDLATLSYARPNVSLDPIGTFRGVANFAIRGLGINSSIPSIDPAVGLFVDGVYMGINAGTVLDMLDVERVEILRGPQGVAFGRNTTGGAVMVKTADPAWAWEGQVRMGYEGPVDGDRGAGMASVQGVVSGPLSDAVAFRLGALHSSDRGYFRNDFDGRPFGRARTTVVRGGVALRAAPSLSFTLKGEWTASSGDGAPSHNNGLYPRDSFALSLNQPGFHDSDGGFVMLRGDLALGEGRLSNIFGWRSYRLDTRNDIDSSPVKLFESDTATDQEQWSNELYYALDHAALGLIVGAYVFHQRIGYDETRDLTGLGIPAIYHGGGRQDHDVYGLYAQADYALTGTVSFTAGLRWSQEDKSAAVTYVRPRAPCSAIAATCPTSGERVPGESNGFADSRSWKGLAPRLALSFSPSEKASFYAGWSRGYRSGGYNLRITQPAAFEEVAARLGSPAFDEERVDGYEIGLHWRPASRVAQIHAAAFWNTIDGLQREVNVPSLTSGLAQSVYNTADARIRGGEIEASLAPLPGLVVAANAGLTDADYRRVFFDLNSDGVINAADLALRLPRAPRWTWGAGISHTASTGLGELSFHASFQHRSAYAYTDNNWGFNSASDRLDASIRLKLAEPQISLALYGRNLLDEVQFGGDTQLPFAGGAFSDGTNRPFDPRPAAGTFSPMHKGRVIGLELAADF